MVIRNEPLSWYVDKLKNNEYFSQGMYADGELGFATGSLEYTTHGLVCYPDLREALDKSLDFKSDNFYFSIPKDFLDERISVFGKGHLEKLLKKHNIEEIYEKDIWYKEMVAGNLGGLIEQLRKMNVIIVSNAYHRGLTFLNYSHFIEIPFYNCWKEHNKIIEKCLEYGKSGVYLITAGPSAALIAQDLHGKIPNSWFIDVGSIWEAFIGLGGTRGFRMELYADPVKYEEWANKNLNGIVEKWPMPKTIIQ